MGTQLGIRRLTGAIGAEVSGINLNVPLDETIFEAIHQAFLDHCLLVFRGQFLQPAAQAAFTHRWGEAVITPYLKAFQVPDYPEIVAVSNVGKAKTVTEEWHSDSSLLPTPPAHAILAAQVVPEVGGDTMFANQYVAYEALSEGMKRLLQGLRAWHGGAKLAAFSGMQDSAPPQSHPVVRTHPETGRKALYVNRIYTTGFEGMTVAESRGLLEFLLEHCCRPDFTYRHQWTAGDVLMWDNRCTVHYAVHDYGEAPRVMHRTTIAGYIPR
jgi:alpha-ketoglutarate-dependent taurine dioxygenase